VFVVSLTEAEGRSEEETKSSKSGIIKLDAIRVIMDKVRGGVVTGWGL